MSQHVLQWGFCQVHGSFTGTSCFKCQDVHYISGAQRDTMTQELAALRAENARLMAALGRIIAISSFSSHPHCLEINDIATAANIASGEERSADG